MQVDLYRAEVKGATDAPVADLIASGAIRMSKIATIELPRRKEWLGW